MCVSVFEQCIGTYFTYMYASTYICNTYIHYITLHCIALHYITLHYITYIYIYTDKHTVYIGMFVFFHW